MSSRTRRCRYVVRVVTTYRINVKQPCSLHDFMDYLIYVAHDAENLQFYLWLRDYFKRFHAAPKSDKCLSPSWHFDDAPPPLSDWKSSEKMPTLASIRSPEPTDFRENMWSKKFSDFESLNLTRISSKKQTESAVAEANAAAGLKWNSFTVQPFRAEISRVISHYIAPGSPRELNLSHKDRAAVLHALQHTTHPSAFTIIRNMIEMTLRNQSHPNFIRWSICNGNKPRVFFLRSFAAMNILIGFVIAIALTLSSAARWWRILAAPEWWFGLTNIIAAYKGLCVLLHRMHTRNLRPWEIEDDDSNSPSDEESIFKRISDTSSLASRNSRWSKSIQTFGEANDYEKETWIDKYRRRPIYRKILEKSVVVQEEGLRLMQNKIIRQSEAWALIITIPLTIAFVALPKGKYY